MSNGPKPKKLRSMLQELGAAFDGDEGFVLEHRGKAMARGKNGEPRFVVVRRSSEDTRRFLTVVALGKKGIPKGEWNGYFPYPDELTFELTGIIEPVHEPLNIVGNSLRGDGQHVFGPAEECARLLVPKALKAEPIPVDARVYEILMDHIT